MLVSAIHQHESATGVHMSLPLRPPSHRRGCHSTGLSSLRHAANPLCRLFHTWGCMCFHATLSTHPTFSLPHCVHKSALYARVSIAALQIGEWCGDSFKH